MIDNFNSYLIELTKATSCEEVEVIQSLWSGYGKISRYQLSYSYIKSVVVKQIQLQKPNSHPRGWLSDVGHQRKLKSYQVENSWYESWNHLCTNMSKTPHYIGSYEEEGRLYLVLEDLIVKYPLVIKNVALEEIKLCLKWLANFHATFMMKEPDSLWKIGTYWHLDTRPDEWKQIDHETLKSKAKEIDAILNNCDYQTIIHGDAKLANFCFSKDKKQVAAVDFQYVGGGCGMKDVAYFLGSCMTSNELFKSEKELLDYYFKILREALKENPEINLDKLEIEWRSMYKFAVTDFVRFMLGWMPDHQKINEYSLNYVDDVLIDLTR